MYLTEATQRSSVYSDSHLRDGQSVHHTEKHGYELASYIASSGKERWVLLLSLLPPFFVLFSQWRILPTSRVVFPLGKRFHRHAQRCVFYMTLSRIRLTKKINHCKYCSVNLTPKLLKSQHSVTGLHRLMTISKCKINSFQLQLQPDITLIVKPGKKILRRLQVIDGHWHKNP